MRSIRLSLLLYFLALLGLALSAVFTLVYQTTSKTLMDKQASTANLVWTQYNDHVREARAALDQRIFRQAMLLVSKSRTRRIRHDIHVIAMTVAQSGMTPTFTTAWFISPYTVTPRYAWVRGFDVVIPDADDYLPPPDERQPQEIGRASCRERVW